MGRTANIVLTVLALAEVGAAVYVVRNQDGSNAATAGPRTTRTSAATSPSLGVGGVSTSTSSLGPVVAFLGDDWTRGTGASAKGNRFTTLVCEQLGAQERNFGADGTGYAKAGPDAGPYATRVAQVVAADPEVVVVSGGRNDQSDNPQTLADAARALFVTLHAKLPDARIIAVAPFWGDSDLPPEMVDLAAAVEEGVTAVGGTYLDLEDPIHGHPAFMADLADPNDAGYAAIATALEPELEPLLPA